MRLNTSTPTSVGPLPNASARILIVEDEAIVALDIQNHLERLGYSIVGVAASGREACEMAESHHPDLILMDIQIQGPANGIDTAVRIRQTQSIPVVFLTAFITPSIMHQAKAAEPYGYIVKPFDRRDLHTTIQMAIYKATLDRELQASHDDLRSILDAQRHGTLILDENEQIVFLSESARRMLAIETEVRGRPWKDVLGLNSAEADALSSTLSQPTGERLKVAVRLRTPLENAPVEIEVRDDLRSTGRKVIFLYDMSQVEDLRHLLEDKMTFESMIGKSKPMQQVFQLIHDFSHVDASVLIEGETGTGKELVARAIHNRSHRAKQAFLAVNCAGLGEELAASQLFGHKRGAFTGAVADHIGLFEAADEGTLFLDEIGELPIRVQTTLLRVLEERAVMRLGDTRLRKINTRIVAATNRDLSIEVAEQRFRADLLYRIRVGRIRLPRLVERREDIPLMVRTFLRQHAAANGKSVCKVSDNAMSILLAYDWPGNVRELKNALEYALIRAQGPTIGPGDLPSEVLDATITSSETDNMPVDERGRILAALESAKGNRGEAALRLGMSRATLYRRLTQLGIHDELE